MSVQSITGGSFYMPKKALSTCNSTRALSISPSRASFNSSFYTTDNKLQSLQKSIPLQIEFKTNTLNIMQKLSHFNRSVSPTKSRNSHLIRSDFQVMKKHITTQLDKMEGNHILTNKKKYGSKNFNLIKALCIPATDKNRNLNLSEKLFAKKQNNDYVATKYNRELFPCSSQKMTYKEGNFQKEKMKLGFFKAMGSNYENKGYRSQKRLMTQNNDNILKELLKDNINQSNYKNVEIRKNSFKKMNLSGKKLDAVIEINKFSHQVERKSADKRKIQQKSEILNLRRVIDKKMPGN